MPGTPEQQARKQIEALLIAADLEDEENAA
jgi:hypothetical protein